MTLKQTRLVTTDVAKLTRFYESVSQATTQAYGDGVAEAAANRSVILDFEVDNVDAEYERLQASVSDWVMAPKVMPWGARAIVFRDPDGNLVNMYSHP